MDKRIFYVFGVLTGILLAFVFVRRKLDRLNELEEQEKAVREYNEKSIHRLDKAISEAKMETALRKAERRFRDDNS